MFILSACGFLFGCTYLYYAKNPIVDLRVFKDHNFALGTLQIAFMGFILYASAVLIPQFAQQQLGYTATWAGLVLAPGAVVLVLLIPAVGRILNYVPVKYVIAFGGAVLSAALFYSSYLVPDMDFNQLMILRATQTSGLAFLFVPISTIAYATVPKELTGDATALFSMARNVVGGIGISVSTALVTDHLQTRQGRLADNLTPTSQGYVEFLQQVQRALVDTGQTAAQAAESAPRQVFQMLRDQAAVLAYSDVFIITAVMTLIMIPTALFMSGIKGKGGAGPG
jgi:DHA2 family multidrug resistance protein